MTDGMPLDTVGMTAGAVIIITMTTAEAVTTTTMITAVAGMEIVVIMETKVLVQVLTLRVYNMYENFFVVVVFQKTTWLVLYHNYAVTCVVG